MIPAFTETDRVRSRRATHVPLVLERWAIQNGFAQYRWLQIFPTEDLTDKDVYSIFGQTLHYVVESEGYRYFVGESSKIIATFPTYYWLVVPS